MKKQVQSQHRSRTSGDGRNNPLTPALAVRLAVVTLLDGVLRERRQLSELLAEGTMLGPLSGPDRARAQRLTNETLRNLDRADFVLSRFIDRLPPAPGLLVLRLATVELCALGEAAHGVVDSAVTLMRKDRRSAKMAGLANAVLRKVASEGPALWATLPPPQLPSWLRRRLIHIYDEAIVQAMETAHLSPAPTDLTVRDSSQTQAWAVTLGAEHLPTGSLRLPASGQLTDLPGYAEGAWWVQDAAAAIPVRALAPQKGEQILDLCAAPGGKSMQLAASGAKVTALDSSATRMARVQENLARTGLHAHCVVADALTWSNARTFDAVLLDAPCSATGTVRRHPDLPHVKGGKGLHDVFELQSRMIDAALSFLKPGGRLTYCTCSLLTEEGELQAKTAIERHGLLDETPAPEDLGLPTTSRVPTGGLRLRPDFWPERGGMDGFFVAVLRKSENGGPNTG